MRVLGVDPGLTRCGLGVVAGNPGGRLSLVEVQVVRSSAEVELGQRLLALSTEIREVVARTSPDVVVIERVFSQLNVRSVMGTAQASAAAVLVAAEAGVRVRWHTPTEVKAAVTGTGQASKAQVAAMVCRILGLQAAPTPVDATDALALAICHIWRGKAQDRIAAAARAAPSGRIPRPGPRSGRRVGPVGEPAVGGPVGVRRVLP